MKAYYSDHFVLPLPAGHRFPMAKYKMLRDLVVDLPDAQLLEAPRASDTELLLAHDASYLQRVISGTLSEAEQKEIGFPWSEKMVERSRRSVGATIAACQSAIEEGVAVNLAGGTHHAYRNKGSGFCVFNDAAIAARMLMKYPIGPQRVGILDLDVHQGDGTAAILQHDPAICTVSIHGEKNYPFAKTNSDLDIALADGSGDTIYLEAVEQALEFLAKHDIEFLIYLAGADPFEGDRLGRLRLTKEGLALRDQRVMAFVGERGISIAIAMAGGYANPIEDTVQIHYQTIQIASAHQHKMRTSKSRPSS
ncbi:histone deacetylase family protein [Polynucleobacter sp. HIN7]|uniref:histone deacetylase family protein n=1 Tax=Polynucleobacter sp. HIN7 TaxID=3047866 RepID=UPI0025730C0F|nr:histone deacetylase [Polynucleobacter sp. HIN7]BEI37288.1 histone deacetylase [Polynucleobacter sp. HIN7]